MTLDKILEAAPSDKIIMESFVIANTKFRDYEKILCSVSGGSDSDVLIDICEKLEYRDKVTYVFFDTGLEYKATKEHLDFLEEKYDIVIHREKAIKPIPTCCRLYGQPFLSKQVSEWISRLQAHNFKWENESFDELIIKYPKCRAALRWWCNDFGKDREKGVSSFDIDYNQYLKEFMINNPPKFRISNKCCKYAKKEVARKYRAQGDYGLNIYGVRKSEGGARKTAYKSCFTSQEEGVDEYRPIFWYLSDVKKTYESHYNVTHSKCYSEYGLQRTGCAGCPFGRGFEDELKILEKYEPNLFVCVNNIFRESYEYTRAYRAYVAKKKAEHQ